MVRVQFGYTEYYWYLKLRENNSKLVSNSNLSLLQFMLFQQSKIHICVCLGGG